MPVYHTDHTPLDASDLRIAVVTSSYHDDITEPLLQGARSTFLDAGGRAEHLICTSCPGAWELPVAIAAMCDHTHPPLDALVALGCVIRGDTTHDHWINQSVCSTLCEFSVRHVTPVALGLLTCETMQQARDRAGGDHGNKGAEAMSAAILQALAIRQVRATAAP